MRRIDEPVLSGPLRAKARRGPFFEGWYFRHISLASDPSGRGARTVSFALVLSKARAGAPEGDRAFVRMLDGSSGKARHFPFSREDFTSRGHPFEVTIGGNRFSRSGIHLSLEDEQGRVEAELEYGSPVAPRRGPFWASVMGPYALLPFMGCRQAITSLGHSVDGAILLRGAGPGSPEEAIRFNGGRGFIDKQWGRSLPLAWVWVQASAFPRSFGDASFFLALADIPWMSGSFKAFVTILYVAGREYRFATYTGARVELLEIDGLSIRMLVADSAKKLEVTVRRHRAGSMAVPDDGIVDRGVDESNDSWVRVSLKVRHGPADVLVFDSVSAGSGVEVAGDVDALRPRA